MAFADVLGIVNVALVSVTATLAFVSIRKFRNSRGIDFILNAESAIDPIRHGLVGAEPALIRNIYGNFGLDGLSDDDCRALPFMHSVYAHVSRMYFILSSDNVDQGLSPFQKEETVQSWVRYLVMFKEHPAMIVVHRQAMRDRDRNSAFLALARDLLGEGTQRHEPA